ncbi:MAG TPA: hypothetical protein VJO12_00625 [Stellaceae bacterium]|nr:hypothetical protein [Stellaceae bacterium]
MPGFVKCVFAAMLLAAPAAHAADWLDEAWSDEAIGKTGTPAITLGASAVLLVLPAATLAEAHAQGVSTPDAVRLFLGRYGQHCSAGLDLDRPHPGLRVQLFLQKPVALEDAGERLQSEILDALKSAKTKKLPRVDQLFAVTDAPDEVVIDYVPQRQARCVRPGDAVS